MPPELRRSIARAALAPLAAVNLLVGLLAALAPRTFYDDFPFLASWVDQLPPYNEHLTTDVGAFYLGFGVLFAWAAVTLGVCWSLRCAWPGRSPRPCTSSSTCATWTR